jgi:predicted  nucleic acid-binding Zn-ribbon protein
LRDLLDRLIDLQETDIAIVACQKEEDQLPRDLDLRENKLKTLEEKAGEASEEVERVRTHARELDRQLDEINNLVRKGQARLLLVKTQRENQAVAREAEFARKRKGELELQVREVTTERSAVEGVQAELAARMEEERKAFAEEKARAAQRLAALRREREELVKKREVAAPLLDAESRTQYERIFKRYRGQAVVRVIKGVCKGCFMTVPPQLYNQVLAKDRIHACPNCGRIIYVEEG